MADGRFNARHPAVKRLLREIRELQREDSGDIAAEALEDNIFEWHFAIRGAPGTEFEGGIYHGRLLLPPEYPFKPPAFMLLTPNGRFETNTKICLSISSHHPEHWQPSWSVRTALTALIAFLPTPAGGAIGSLEFPKEERQRLAAQSRLQPPDFGSAERQAVSQAVHERMLAAETQPAAAPPAQDGEQQPAPAGRPEAAAAPEAAATPEAAAAAAPTPATVAAAEASPDQAAQAQPLQQGDVRAGVQGSDWEDRGLGFLAAALSIAIMAILGRRLLIVAGVDISNFF